jgi:hypothetical protein
MKPSEFIGDELYQVNLILWMLQPSTGHIVKPILAKAGLILRDIEVELPLNIALTNQLAKAHLEVSDPVAPDMLLTTSNSEFVLVECKRSMFGSSVEKTACGSQVKQARSLLLQVPRFLALALGLQPKDIKKTFVTYVSRYDASCEQTLGLKQSAEDLREKGYRTNSFGLLTLSIEDKAVMVGPSKGATLPSGMKRMFSKGAIKAHELSDNETDPRPLYIIPWMPGGNEDVDDYGQIVFGNRILAATTARVGPAAPPCDIEIDVDEVLGDATQGYYRHWKKKASRKALRENAKTLIKGVLDKFAPDVPVDLLGNPSRGWKISLKDDSTKSAVVEGLRKWKSLKWNSRPQATLFDQEG